MTRQLANGNEIPMIGLGVFKSEEGSETVNAVRWAIESGYKHIDTAALYANEKSVGLGIKESGVDRSELFITTKLANPDTRAGKAREGFYTSLEKMGLDYIDLYLIHWPVDGRVEAWLEMEKLYKEGLIKNIGVSNFHKVHLDEFLKVTNIVPQINQIESHPKLQNTELIEYCRGLGIEMEAWSPLGGGKTATEMLQSPQLIELGAKYNKSPAQIIIRWNLQRGVVVLPKSVNKGRIAENINVFDFQLSEQDMEVMKGMNTNSRVGSDPENFNF